MQNMDLTEQELAEMIDHTALKPEAQYNQIAQLCQEAREYGFGAVCIAPAWVDVVKKELEQTKTRIASVIGFPHGNTRSEIKAFEAERVITLGANELDMVINIGALKDSNEKDVVKDIEAVVKVAHMNSSLVKVIIEAGLLTAREKEQACLLAKQAGADFVKTSTGFAGEGKGATIEDVRLMHECVGDTLGIKAAGGIRDCKIALEMINAGATRLGCSSSVKILEQFRTQHCAESDL
jgi:deoxyribose-phosphate aldolase